MTAIGGVTISDILDFSVGTSFSSSLKEDSLSYTTRRELLFDVQSNADKFQVSYDIYTFSSAHDTNYFISVLEMSVETGQFINLVNFYSLQNNVSTFQDMVSISIVCTSKLVPSVQPSPSLSLSTTINNTLIIYNASSIPSVCNSNNSSLLPSSISPIINSSLPSTDILPTIAPSIAPSIDQTVIPSSISPITNSSPLPSDMSTSFIDSPLPTIAPTIRTTSISTIKSSCPTVAVPTNCPTSKAPHVKPSYKPSTTLSIAPSVRPGDPTLTPSGKMIIVQNLIEVF